MNFLYKSIKLAFITGLFFTVSSLIAEQSSPTGYSKKQIIDLINQTVQDAPFIPETLIPLVAQINQDESTLTEEILEKVLKILLGLKIAPEQRAELKKTQDTLSKILQTYKACGPTLASDFNGGFIVDTQDPRFTVTYKNAAGKTKTRTYQADISLVGLNIEIALRLSMIFFVGTDFNFYETNKIIELGKGIQLSPGKILQNYIPFLQQCRNKHTGKPMNNREAFLLWRDNRHQNIEINYLSALLQSLNLTYVPFSNMNGGMIIVSTVLGFDDLNLNMVTGGTLTPLA